MDAAHLMLTVQRARAAGINAFAMIHDSFGCHAARAMEFSRIIREAFVQLYTIDVLADFIEQLKAQLPEHLARELPPPPPRGDFDIALVGDSEFFFS
jgi:DNA-directed RNA polymerase